MSYPIGVDIGSTFTTVAVVRGGRADVVSVVPTEVPTGGFTARRFLNRIGDDTPVLVGTRPVPAETLAARLVGRVVAATGVPAARVAVTYPVTWGPHRFAALQAALGEVTLLSDALAVAKACGSAGPTAVHDLGGSSFTASVVRGAGAPVDLDFGGADLDELIFDHVRAALPDWPADVDPASLTALRRECTMAKETLSADTEATIPVSLPGINAEVRLTRAEFEELARPALEETAAALQTAIELAGIVPTAVLLAGGGARLPLLTQLVSEQLRRPVRVAPPGAAAIGAALAAAEPLRAKESVRSGPVLTGRGFHDSTASTRSARPPAEPTRVMLRGFAADDEPAKPPRPAVPVNPGPATHRPSRKLLAAVAAAVAAVGATTAVALASGQTPPGAGADPVPTTTTVTVTTTEPVPTTTVVETPAETPKQRQTQPPRTRRTTPPTTTTTSESVAPTTTTAPPSSAPEASIAAPEGESR
jgi:actin-like ATPase involved in cell morphogenesis